MTERLLLQYRIAFGLVVVGIAVAVGTVVRASIVINAHGASQTRATTAAALAGGRHYALVAVTVVLIGMVLGVVTTLESQRPVKR